MKAHMSRHTTNASFDTESGPVGIYNRCSGCMSNKSNDFDGELRPVKRVIKGFGGSHTYNVMMGTIKWKVGTIQEKYTHSESPTPTTYRTEESDSSAPNTGQRPKKVGNQPKAQVALP